MSSSQAPTKAPAPAVAEGEKQNDTVTDAIAYARRTYKGSHPDVKTFEPEKYGIKFYRLHVLNVSQQRPHQEVLQQREPHSHEQPIWRRVKEVGSAGATDIVIYSQRSSCEYNACLISTSLPLS